MMKFATLLRKPPEWMLLDGPHRDIVITSRVRLARNLDGPAFPGFAKKEDRTTVMQELQPVVEGLPEMKDGFSEDLGALDAIRKQVLVEKHLISREQAAKSGGSAAVINRDQSLSIMINEEDHLRMQSIRSGLALRVAYAALDRVDEELDGDLEPVQGQPNEDQHLAKGKYRVGGAIGPAEMRLHHQLAQYACDQGTEQSAVPRHLLQEVLKLLIDWTACWI